MEIFENNLSRENNVQHRKGGKEEKSFSQLLTPELNFFLIFSSENEMLHAVHAIELQKIHVGLGLHVFKKPGAT